MENNHAARRYWRANERVILGLLVVWLLVGIVGSILAVVPLNNLRIFGLPLGFWLAQQGAIYVFVGLIFLYAWLMDRLDRRYHVEE